LSGGTLPDCLITLQTALPQRKVGTHGRMMLDDVLAYRCQRDQDRRQALRALVVLAQELGLL